MIVPSKVRRLLLAFLVALPFGTGCGSDLQDNAPAEMPNVGPGEPPGVPPGAKAPPSSGKAEKAKTDSSKK